MKLSASLLALSLIILLASASLAASQYVEIVAEPLPPHLKNITLLAGQELYLNICGPQGAFATFYLYELSTGDIVYNISFPIGLTGCTLLRLKAPGKSGLYIALFNVDGLTQMLLLEVEPSSPSPTITPTTITVTSTTTIIREISITKTVTVTKTITTTTISYLPIIQPVTVYVTEYSISPLAPKVVFTRVYEVTTTTTTTTTIYRTFTATTTMPIYQTVYKVVEKKVPVTETSYKTAKITETKVVKETVVKPVLVREHLISVSSLVATLILGITVGATIVLVYARR